MIDLDIKTIREIQEKIGKSVYLFNQDEFESNYHELENTFKQVYSNYRICYSYKTNYTPEICKCVKRLGGYAEVVSDFEYKLALKIGYKPNKIVFNGPIKGDYLRYHLINGGINNIDRVEEAEYICSFAKNNPKQKVKTGVRINFDIDAGYISRFGIDIDQIGYIFDLLILNGVTIAGIHCHMSRARSLESWKLRAKTMLDIVEKYKLTDIDYISLGSGMYGKMDYELQKQFPADIPTYSDYANVVMSQFSDYYKDKKKKPILFTEPGTTLISKYVDFLGSVIGVKKIKGSMFILMDCSFHNLGETCQMKNLPIRIYDTGSEKIIVDDAKLVGYTCLEQDVLYSKFSGNIAIGDAVVFGNVGGYSLVDKPPFIMPNCPVIAIKNNKIKIIKRQESWGDFFSTFVF